MSIASMSVRWIASVILIAFSAGSYAATTSGPFSFTPQGSLPTMITSGGAVTFAYTLTNLSSHSVSAIVQGFNGGALQIPNATISPAGCGWNPAAPYTPFTLAGGASCTLNVVESGPLNPTTLSGNQYLSVCYYRGLNQPGTTCSGIGLTGYPTVSTTTRTQHAYIANLSGGISICAMNTNGDGGLGHCYLQNDPTFTNPMDVILNSDSTIAYVANSGNNGVISICPVDASTGGFLPCTASAPVFIEAGGAQNTGLQIAGNYIYATDYQGPVRICPIQSDGSLGTCSTSAGGGTFSYTSGRIAFNRAGTVAFVPNYWGTSSPWDISVCQANATDGSLTSCAVFSDPSMYKTFGTVMNPLGNNLYIANGANNNHVLQCPININGSFGICTSMTDSSFALGDYGLNMFVSSSQYAYIPNPNGGASGTTLSICPIQSDGSFGTCTTSAGSGTFGGPTGVWISFAS